MTEMDDEFAAQEDDEAGSAEVAVPAPRENSLLLGHDKAEASLLQAISAGRLPHGLLITGPHGIGKATLAYRVARVLLAQPDSQGGLFAGAPAPPVSLALDRDHPVFKRVASGGHADLMSVERSFDVKRKKIRTEIVVEDVRDIGAFLHLTPAEGGWRIVIVDTADELNRNAANALLKVLEEPPARALVILLSDNPGRLLPTIRSRCRVFALRPLARPVLTDLLDRYRPGLSAADRGALLDLSKGSIGRALDFAAQGGLSRQKELSKLMMSLPGLDGVALQAFAAKLAGEANDAAYRVVADLMPATLARAIAQAAQSSIAGEGSEAGFVALLRRRGLDRCVEVWEKITDLFAQSDAVNLDRKQVVLNAFFALEEVLR